MTLVRTTIFGGSFNPIHNGHIRLSRHILDLGLTDEVWLLVSPQNPLKQKKGLLHEKLRLKLAKLALENEPHIHASDFEFSLPRPSYTWLTLRALHEKYPKRCFSLLIGADNWLIFNQWAHANDILENYQILIYPREDYIINSKELPASVTLIKNAPIFPYSSTQIRQALKAGKDCSEMLPNIVARELTSLSFD